MRWTVIQNRMKDKIVIGIFTLMLCCGCLLTSCRDEGEAYASPAGKLDLKLMLQLPQQISVTTRGANDQTLNGYTITDVRAFQFPTSGGTEKTSYYSSATADWAEVKENEGLQIKTGNNDFDAVDCSFYFAVNAGDKLENITTIGGLQGAALALSDFSTDLVNVEPAVFVCGPVVYKQVAGATSKPVALLARLARMHAKLTVNYTVTSGLTITAARVENIPAMLYPFPNAATTPEPSAVTSPATPEYTTTTLSLSPTTNTFSIFLPENLRGNGKASTQSGKNVAANGPDGTLDLCTCIVLEGTYNYYPDEADKAPINVEYRFYPGADMIRNYNIERGKHYTMDVKLTGANSADARVTVTNGNVFMITDPDELEYPDIEF
ncbi:DUF4906 domain-containing protein [Bacteroides sp. GD17]|jgi:hypothetical protein|uniref:DUF4906 domain-containing protein n=1 Tax=Bacteroides sp. GD17 TaxID=3139826 RepID=UPI0025FACC37|nr:DUF4906 domain-containing protein [uncultured Bacteroides sp.]